MPNMNYTINQLIEKHLLSIETHSQEIIKHQEHVMTLLEIVNGNQPELPFNCPVMKAGATIKRAVDGTENAANSDLKFGDDSNNTVLKACENIFKSTQPAALKNTAKAINQVNNES